MVGCQRAASAAAVFDQDGLADGFGQLGPDLPRRQVHHPARCEGNHQPDRLARKTLRADRSGQAHGDGRGTHQTGATAQ
jgi:hypothetical protein